MRRRGTGGGAAPAAFHQETAAVGACTRPCPRSAASTPGAKGARTALARSRASTARLVRGRLAAPSACHQSAATPATCGQAIEVPFSDFSPPPGQAETTPTPGAETTGLVLEKGATVSPFAPSDSAPTDTTPSAAAGTEALTSKSGAICRSLSLPLAAQT